MLTVMLVRWTRQNTVLVALLLATLMTVLPSAKSQNRRGSQTAAPRHATKSLADIPSSDVSNSHPRSNPVASRKNRTKASVPGTSATAMANHSALTASNSRTSSDAGYSNRSMLPPADSLLEPFRDGIYSPKEQSKKPGSKNKQKPQFRQEEIQVGCRELQARRYITDGFCTSFKVINEVVCTGHCLPEKDLPWYAEFVKTIARSKLKEWHCVEDRVQKKPIDLVCQDGSTRQYTIKVVKSCKCKKLKKKHNRTNPDNNQETKKSRRRGKIPKDISAKGS